MSKKNNCELIMMEDFEILYNYSYMIYKRARLVINITTRKEYSMKSIPKSELIYIGDLLETANPLSILEKHPFVVSLEC